jgi:hypothetical protein
MTDVITINEVIQLVKVEEKHIEVVTVGTQGPPGTGGGSGSSDHGALTGLEDDDHPHYHNDARGDARYYTKSQVDGALALIPKTGQVTVDFGNASGGEADLASVTVAAAWVTDSSVIVCTAAGVATPDHDAEDAALEGIQAVAENLNEGVGFDVIARAPQGSWGRFNINIMGV